MSGRMWTIEIPMPAAELKPNNAPFNQAQARKKREAARQARWAAKIAGMKAIRAQAVGRRQKPKLLYASAGITRHYQPPAKPLDPDNLKAMLKSTWDGLQDAGLLADDKHLVVGHPIQRIGSRPGVVIVIRQIEDGAA